MPVMTPGFYGRRGSERFLGRAPRGRGLPFAVVLVLVSALVAGSSQELSNAVLGSTPRSSAAQVRIFLNGEFLGGGTLVDRSWVLTAGHVLDPIAPTGYTMRFGVVDNQGDQNDDAHLRMIDDIMLHPELADVAMVHLADPVPPDTWIPRLATQAPNRRDAGRLYGWGPDGSALHRALGTIIDPVAVENAAAHREASAVFADMFPGNIEPMVMNVGIAAVIGDSGGGVFTSGGVLTAFYCCRYGYRPVDRRGNLRGRESSVAYEQPVWQHREWILSVINGEGSSNGPPDGELKRRRLTEASTGDPPMTLPPQVDVCDAGEASCAAPDPIWVVGSLTGSGNYRGTALAVCAQAAGNSCSFNGSAYAGGAIGRLALGPTNAPETTPRQVMVWCKTSNVFAEGARAQPALRVSFTNDEPEEVPVGMGWWDVTPDQVGTGAGGTPVDTGPLSTC